MREPDHVGYDAYVEIKGELIRPISKKGLDCRTLRRLYESKAVYLENLRLKCFRDMNIYEESSFTSDDYHFILNAAKINKEHLRKYLIKEITDSIYRRKAV